MEYTLDAQSTKVTILTRAAGLLSALAHDLEIAVQPAAGSATAEDAGYTARLRFPVSAIHVVGALKHGTVDPHALTPSDRQQIEGRIAEVLSPLTEIVVDVTGRGDRARVTVSARRPASTSLLVRQEANGDEVTVDGFGELSISAMGLPEIRGPLSAFKVKDALDVRFHAVFRRG